MGPGVFQTIRSLDVTPPQLCDLAHCFVLSGPVPPTFPSICKDVMSASTCRRPEAQSGTHSTGGGPYSYRCDQRDIRGLMAGCRANKCCGRENSTCREEDIQGLFGGKENFIYTKGSVSRISTASDRGPQGENSLIRLFPRLENCVSKGPGGCSLGLYLGSLLQDPDGSTEALHGGCSGRHRVWLEKKQMNDLAPTSILPDSVNCSPSLGLSFPICSLT